MSIASEEACRYEGEADLEACTVLVANQAYFDGRTAPVTDTEIEAATQYVKDSAANFFGTPAVSKVPEHRLRKFAKGILNAARKAVEK